LKELSQTRDKLETSYENYKRSSEARILELEREIRSLKFELTAYTFVRKAAIPTAAGLFIVGLLVGLSQ